MNAELMINMLRSDEPAIYDRLARKIAQMFPLTESEAPNIEKIIAWYCRQEGIDRGYLKSSTAHRRRLLAFCIMHYQPEKMVGLSKRRLKNGIIQGISDYCGCGVDSLKKWVGEVIFQYINVASFRSDIDALSSLNKN